LASDHESGSTGIFMIVVASSRLSLRPPFTDAQPGDSGSPTATGMSITLPRCALSAGRYGPWGKRVSLEVAVVARIGVNQAPDRTVLGRDFGLSAAPTAAIAGDNDFTLDVDS
jgi:hypothetical protein